MMRPNIEVMCIVKFQYATSAMLALPYDHFLVLLLFLDVPITVVINKDTPSAQNGINGNMKYIKQRQKPGHRYT